MKDTQQPFGNRSTQDGTPEPPSIGDWTTMGEAPDSKRPFEEPPSIGSLPTRDEWPISDDRRFHSRRWQPGEEILGRYVVEKELGQGGMGVVYGCFDKVGGVRVAVKALPPELSHNSVEMEEVRENFQLVYKLSHPNIAGVRTLEKDARGEYFLVMEIAEGESLRKWIRRKWKAGGVTLEEAVGVLRQVAAALDYAHSEKVVHRDVKPGNILIDANGRVKVLDFGLAAQIRTSLSRASQAYRGTSGTGPYMAPEQWRGQAQEAKADQYALGVLAYEMLSGHLPFENADAVALREAVLREEAPVIPNLPRLAMAAIRRAMAKKADDRFGSCREFVAALAGEKPEPAGRGSGWGWLWAVLFAMVLVAVAVSTAVAVSKHAGKVGKAQTSAAKQAIAAIASAIDLYEMDNGRFPDSLQNLVSKGSEPNWSGPYLKKAEQLNDPWGTQFQYTKSANSYSIVSAGPDKAFGTADDVK